MKSTGPSDGPVSVLQIPGCLSGTGSGGAAKAAADSCFDYQFGDVLVVQFCAQANCCPDSNRFSVQHRISADTIYVTIADTAAHLCRCNCSYSLVMMFEGLEKSDYLFFCTREDYSSRYVLYSNRVERR